MDVAAARGPAASAAVAATAQQVPRDAAPARSEEDRRRRELPPTDGCDLKFTLERADLQARFAIHEATNRVMITVYHRQTGEIVREIPPKELLDMLAAFGESGLIVDQTR